MQRANRVTKYSFKVPDPSNNTSRHYLWSLHIALSHDIRESSCSHCWGIWDMFKFQILCFKKIYLFGCMNTEQPCYFQELEEFYDRFFKYHEVNQLLQTVSDSCSIFKRQESMQDILRYESNYEMLEANLTIQECVSISISILK